MGEYIATNRMSLEEACSHSKDVKLHCARTCKSCRKAKDKKNAEKEEEAEEKKEEKEEEDEKKEEKEEKEEQQEDNSTSWQELCEDDPDWVDKDKDGCDTYSEYIATNRMSLEDVCGYSKE